MAAVCDIGNTSGRYSNLMYDVMST